jgi:hypothetical protein
MFDALYARKRRHDMTSLIGSFLLFHLPSVIVLLWLSRSMESVSNCHNYLYLSLTGAANRFLRTVSRPAEDDDSRLSRAVLCRRVCGMRAASSSPRPTFSERQTAMPTAPNAGSCCISRTCRARRHGFSCMLAVSFTRFRCQPTLSPPVCRPSSVTPSYYRQKPNSFSAADDGIIAPTRSPWVYSVRRRKWVKLLASASQRLWSLSRRCIHLPGP